MRDSMRVMFAVLVALCASANAAPADAEDGYRLWLRYDPLPTALRTKYAPAATEVVSKSNDSVARSAASELQRGLSGMLAARIAIRPAIDRDGAILVELVNEASLGTDGFSIKTRRVAGHRATVIAAANERGLLYGAFAFLRQMQMQQAINRLDVRDHPKFSLRVLDHWDNLNGSVE